MRKYEENLNLSIQSGCHLIQIVSFEWRRIHGIVNKVSNWNGNDWFTWSVTRGLRRWDKSNMKFIDVNPNMTDPMQVLNYFDDLDTSDILILEDFHPFLSTQNYQIINLLREIIRVYSNKTIIISTPIKTIPSELSKEMAIIEVDLPGVSTLKVITNNLQHEFPNSEFDITPKLLSSALGLTVMEAEIAYRKALHKYGKLTENQIHLIIDEKENIIKKNGLLEYYHPKDSLNSIGGLDNLKQWVKIRSKAFEPEAKEFGIDLPKGLLLLGVPGCGKSLTAKVIAKTWEFPLLRFDLGKVYGGLVGESERNIREALDVAKALSPCVLWIDEIEKGLSGVQSSGVSDGGTTSRVFGTFLTWMQEKTEPVFVVATANDISLLPPELLRKGRFDEIFFVDLPTVDERKTIFKIHIKKKKKNIKDFDIDKLAKASAGYTGAEIEQIVNESLFKAFNENRNPNNKDILESIEEIFPLSQTMSENINSLRQWAKVRARMASKTMNEEIHENKSAPKLKQEYRNPFIGDNE